MNGLLVIGVIVLSLAVVTWLYWRSDGKKDFARLKLKTEPRFPSGEQIQEKLLGHRQTQQTPHCVTKPQDTLWLKPTPELLKRQKRRRLIARLRWPGAVIGVLIVATVTNMAYQKTGLWYVTTAIGSGLSLSLCGLILVWKKQAENAQCALAVTHSGIVFRDAAAREYDVPDHELGFDGTYLYTPRRTLKLLRPASFEERMQWNCSEVPLYQRETFLRNLLPKLIDPAILNNRPQQPQSKGELLLTWGMLIANGTMLLWTFGLIT